MQRPQIRIQPRIRVPAPIIVLPLVYFVAGASIILTGRALGVF